MEHTRIDIANIPFPLAPINLVAGHYGVGKTNLSLNLAHDIKAAGREVTLIDLDVVNPYFRSSDYATELEAAGIRCITPLFAGTSLDLPSLSGTIEPALSAADEQHIVVVDVGGDDLGSTSLGRYSERINALDHRMFYVINERRNLTQSAEEAAQMLSEIEAKAHIKADGIINNSHLKQETSFEMIEKSQEFAQECARLTHLELLATTVRQDLCTALEEQSSKTSCAEPKSSVVLPSVGFQNPYFVQIYVRSSWEL